MITGGTRQVAIVMADGVRLAATLYLPAQVLGTATPAEPVPCLLEALPYRKDDLTASYRPEYVRFRDQHGYAVARVDLRGTGSSSGIALDEYHAQEQADLLEVIAWLAEQPWCTGAIGMFGTSWSGFNALQTAAERPPGLRAVVASYASDDRWTDDVHYQGGALRLLDLVDYPLYMVAMNALPPVPAVFGEGWRKEWVTRAQQTPPWLLGWLEEQTDGLFWRQGSVRAEALARSGSGQRPDPGYARIGCPTMLITGWADGYRNVGYRMLTALHDLGTPVRVLAGPWSHASPVTSVPGPNVDHVPLMAQWWDRWLRDDGPAHQSAIRNEAAQPPLTVFVRGWAAPDPVAAQLPGRWEAHDVETFRAAREVVLDFDPALVSGAEVIDGVAHYEPVSDVGMAGWNSCAAALPWGQPQDQTPDDARSLCLTWPAAQTSGLTVLGHPRLRLRVRPDAAITLVSAKLSLVPASGRPSLLVNRGLLNLAYRGADASAPEPCRPGEWLDVEFELDATAFEVSAGCTLRLALACADWPNIIAVPGTWSAIELAACSLVLPVAERSPYPTPQLPMPQLPMTDPAEPEAGPGGPGDDHDESWVTWQHGQDVLAGTTWAEVDHGAAYTGTLNTGAVSGRRFSDGTLNAGAVNDNPASPIRYGCAEHYTGRVEIDRARAGRLGGEQRVRAGARFDLDVPGVQASSQANLEVTVDSDTLDVRLELDVRDGETLIASHAWRRQIPRLWT